MPLRNQYIRDVRIGKATYPIGAIQRIKDIYKQARRGGCDQALANQIWGRLRPIYRQATNGKLPTNQAAFDQFVVRNAFRMQAVLQNARRGGFGIGQKIVNLFLKDLWALDVIRMPVEQFLHAPIDRRVWQKLSNPPPTWEAWTKVYAQRRNSKEVLDYLNMQRDLRSFQRTSPIRFPSLIQMEQFIWHRI
jgi:hypothetical protein